VGPEFVTARMKAGTRKISVKHDFDRHNDNQAKWRKQNGRHATVTPNRWSR
jgi:hypothetical protein